MKRALLPVLLLAALWVFLDFYCCPVKFVTGLSCPGCGMTRAAIALLHLDFAASWYWHPMLIPTIAAGAVWIWFLSKRDERKSNAVLWIWAVSMIVCWGIRMALFFGAPPMDFSSQSILGWILQWISS
ncbi:MAG: DUF2752 domain-containing protein [Erysipelotrichaceae bacterium]|nr:DUF2752 domain-containing protein [Erysipelotrichaceae bacterium]